MKDLKIPASKRYSSSVVEARFIYFCKNGLSMDESTFTEVMKLFNECKHLLAPNISAAVGIGVPEEAELYWFAFLLYSSSKILSQSVSDDLNPDSDEKRVALCQILGVAKLNLVDFLKKIPQFILMAGPVFTNLYGTKWEKRLEVKELQTNFVHMSLLIKYYKCAYYELFLPKDSNNKQSTRGIGSDYFNFGWLLFLALRAHAFSRVDELVTCTNGLVSVLAVLIIHVPAHFRKFTIDDSSRFIKRGDKGVDLIASLCKMYETSEDELRKTMEQTNKLIESILKKKPCLASECETGKLDNISKDGLIYFDSLMEETTLSTNLSILEKDYEYAISNKGELDERVFLDEDSVLGSGSLSGGDIHMSGTKYKLDSIASPTAMETEKWLRDVICPLPCGPTAELESFLSKCGRSVSRDVVRRAHIILEAIFPCTAPGNSSIAGSSQSTNLIYNIWAEQRRLEAVKLYYRVLLAICTAEAQILNADNLTSLLTSERFHRCMLVCSAELVLATYKVTMFFPVVLERTGITAFDLSKVIETFITHEELLPRELRRHLNSLEEQLLESVVWEKGSSMYNSLTVARPALSAEISHLCLLAEPMPSLDAIAIDVNISSGLLPATSLQKQDSPPGQDGDIQSPNRVCTEPRSVLGEPYSFTSPLKDLLLATNNLNLKLLPTALQSAFSSSAGPNTGRGGETCAETAIDVFFGKIVKLAAVRINGMIESLKLSQQIREKVCCLFEKILLQKTSLFFLRHIDQIILCCLYAVAKISHVSLTFREIMCAYRKQPHSKHQVLEIVFVDCSAMRWSGKLGRGHVDMITFYNELFIPMVKPFLVELAPAGNVEWSNNQISEATNNDDNSQCPGSPKMFKFPSLQDMPRKKVSAVHNVYVSPLRSSKMDDALNSYSSKSYYACVGESNHASKDLTTINSHLIGPKKFKSKLNFDEVGMISDSFVALQIESCASSSSTPKKCEQLDA